MVCSNFVISMMTNQAFCFDIAIRVKVADTLNTFGELRTAFLQPGQRLFITTSTTKMDSSPPLPTSSQSTSTPSPNTAAEQARLRKERREAKIKAGGSARLGKITSMGGRPPESGKSLGLSIAACSLFFFFFFFFPPSE